MRFTVTTNRLDVIGRIWMPDCVCAMSYTLSEHDLDVMRQDGPITRDDVQLWCNSHCGDFQEVIDFAADFGAGEFESTWQKEENEMTFWDCMYGEEG